MGGAWQILVCMSLIFVALVTPVQAGLRVWGSGFWVLGLSGLGIRVFGIRGLGFRD